MSMQAPEHNHLAVHTVLFPKCCCIHVVAGIILKEMSVWELCLGADAVKQQAQVFFEVSLLHVNFTVQQSPCNGPGRRMAAGWNLQDKSNEKNQAGSI